MQIAQNIVDNWTIRCYTDVEIDCKTSFVFIDKETLF